MWPRSRKDYWVHHEFWKLKILDLHQIVNTLKRSTFRQTFERSFGGSSFTLKFNQSPDRRTEQNLEPNFEIPQLTKISNGTPRLLIWSWTLRNWRSLFCPGSWTDDCDQLLEHFPGRSFEINDFIRQNFSQITDSKQDLQKVKVLVMPKVLNGFERSRSWSLLMRNSRSLTYLGSWRDYGNQLSDKDLERGFWFHRLMQPFCRSLNQTNPRSYHQDLCLWTGQRS